MKQIAIVLMLLINGGSQIKAQRIPDSIDSCWKNVIAQSVHRATFTRELAKQLRVAGNFNDSIYQTLTASLEMLKAVEVQHQGLTPFIVDGVQEANQKIESDAEVIIKMYQNDSLGHKSDDPEKIALQLKELSSQVSNAVKSYNILCAVLKYQSFTYGAPN